MENNELTVEQLQQETETVKAVKEELLAQMQELTTKYENTINAMRTEHSRQIKDILRYGAASEPIAEEEDDDVDEDGISKKAVQAQIDSINKKLKL